MGTEENSKNEATLAANVANEVARAKSERLNLPSDLAKTGVKNAIIPNNFIIAIKDLTSTTKSLEKTYSNTFNILLKTVEELKLIKQEKNEKQNYSSALLKNIQLLRGDIFKLNEKTLLTYDKLLDRSEKLNSVLDTIKSKDAQVNRKEKTTNNQEEPNWWKTSFKPVEVLFNKSREGQFIKDVFSALKTPVVAKSSLPTDQDEDIDTETAAEALKPITIQPVKVVEYGDEAKRQLCKLLSTCVVFKQPEQKKPEDCIELCDPCPDCQTDQIKKILPSFSNILSRVALPAGVLAATNSFLAAAQREEATATQEEGIKQEAAQPLIQTAENITGATVETSAPKTSVPAPITQPPLPAPITQPPLPERTVVPLPAKAPTEKPFLTPAPEVVPDVVPEVVPATQKPVSVPVKTTTGAITAVAKPVPTSIALLEPVAEAEKPGQIPLRRPTQLPQAVGTYGKDFRDFYEKLGGDAYTGGPKAVYPEGGASSFGGPGAGGRPPPEIPVVTRIGDTGDELQKVLESDPKYGKFFKDFFVKFKNHPQITNILNKIKESPFLKTAGRISLQALGAIGIIAYLYNYFNEFQAVHTALEQKRLTPDVAQKLLGITGEKALGELAGSYLGGLGGAALGGGVGSVPAGIAGSIAGGAVGRNVAQETGKLLGGLTYKDIPPELWSAYGIEPEGELQLPMMPGDVPFRVPLPKEEREKKLQEMRAEWEQYQQEKTKAIPPSFEIPAMGTPTTKSDTTNENLQKVIDILQQQISTDKGAIASSGDVYNTGASNVSNTINMSNSEDRDIAYKFRQENRKYNSYFEGLV